MTKLTAWVDRWLFICYTFTGYLKIFIIEKGKLLVRVGHKTIGPRRFASQSEAAGEPVANKG